MPIEEIRDSFWNMSTSSLLQWSNTSERIKLFIIWHKKFERLIKVKNKFHKFEFLKRNVFSV